VAIYPSNSEIFQPIGTKADHKFDLSLVCRSVTEEAVALAVALTALFEDNTLAMAQLQEDHRNRLSNNQDQSRCAKLTSVLFANAC
jgi:hypothetical protein